MSEQNQKEVRCTFIYDKDTRRTHRFQIQSADGIAGSIYVPRGMDPIPDVIVLEKHRDDDNGDH
jgi:hypothetical protein